MKNITFKIAVVALICFWSGLGCSSSTKKADSAPQTPVTSMPPLAEAKPAAPKIDSASAWSCKLAKDERSAKIESQGEGCEVQYTKGGKMSVPAQQAHGTQHCKDVFERIRTKLKAAGYQCS